MGHVRGSEMAQIRPIMLKSMFALVRGLAEIPEIGDASSHPDSLVLFIDAPFYQGCFEQRNR